jgi:hypothetical protein
VELVGQGHQHDAADPGLEVLLGDVLLPALEDRGETIEVGLEDVVDRDDAEVDASLSAGALESVTLAADE